MQNNNTDTESPDRRLSIFTQVAQLRSQGSVTLAIASKLGLTEGAVLAADKRNERNRKKPGAKFMARYNLRVLDLAPRDRMATLTVSITEAPAESLESTAAARAWIDQKVGMCGTDRDAGMSDILQVTALSL